MRLGLGLADPVEAVGEFFDHLGVALVEPRQRFIDGGGVFLPECDQGGRQR